MNPQSPTTLDEKLWAAEAEIRRLMIENAEQRIMIASLSKEIERREMEAACKPSFDDDFELSDPN